MSNHYEWGTANTGRYHVLTREAALDAWRVDGAEVDSSVSHVLGVFNLDGDGAVLEGSPEGILDYVDKLHAYAHRELDGAVEREERACASCGDDVLLLPSRDRCDACEAVTIPGECGRSSWPRSTNSISTTRATSPCRPSWVNCYVSCGNTAWPAGKAVSVGVGSVFGVERANRASPDVLGGNSSWPQSSVSNSWTARPPCGTSTTPRRTTCKPIW